MYRLASILLIVLVTIATFLALIGTLPFEPLAIPVSALVFVATTYAASWLLGYIFNIQVHGESSLITGLILVSLFTPSLEVSSLGVFALIGLIAGASKYLLAWRGRHIFNPAAIAAVIIGFTGITYASWWIATPPLFIVTLIAGALLLYKTNRLAMGIVFFVVASVAFTIFQLIYGDTLLAALPLIMSWPIVFFMSFMLTEPLTLPAKRYQALLLAVGLGLLIAVPVDIAGLLITPALALVLTNLIAFIVSHRRRIQLTYEKSINLTQNVHELQFKPGGQVRYQAGQYIELTLPHSKVDGRGERRAFSITSVPGSSTLSIGVKFYEPSSTYKKVLRSLKAGTVVTATSINGSFVLPKDTTVPLLFFAGGIGITPFISHLRDMKQRNESRPITLIYAVTNRSDAAYLDELEDFGITILLVETEKTSYITDELLRKQSVDISGRYVYISGPPLFVSSTKRLVRHRGAKGVRTDYFSGY
jgi:ferredoxin-NADP reductase